MKNFTPHTTFKQFKVMLNEDLEQENIGVKKSRFTNLMREKL